MINVDELWDYGRPAETEAKFRALLPEAEAAGDAEYLAQLLTQLARTLGLQQQFAAAHELLDRAEALAEADSVAQVRYLLERGRCFNSAGDKATARPLFMLDEIGHTHGQIRLLNNQDSAGIVGSTVETVSRNIADFKREGFLQKMAPALYAIDRDLLQNIAVTLE